MTADTNTLYKFLRADGRTPQGLGTWPLPVGDQPGAWLPKLSDPLVACKHAYHVMTTGQVLNWTTNADLYVVETRYQTKDDGSKTLARQARTVRLAVPANSPMWRLFACDCAERVLPLFERDRPTDLRPRAAIATARNFANGQATAEELDAAWDAAWAAARAAAWDAAWDATWDAAWDAARAAEDAAKDAARAATGAAAAAWAAARAAARGAAWDATWDAERQWQAKRLAAYLSGKLEAGR